MFNVLARTVLLVGTLLSSSSIAQPAPFCPDGWTCGTPDGNRAEARQVASRREVCMIHHALTTRDGMWQMMTILYSTDSTREVHIGFAVTLLEASSPGNDFRPVPLRTIRLLSADRRLDTRGWRLDGADTTRTSVRAPATAENEKEIVGSIAIATGAAYGALAETTDGRQVRIEAAAMARVPAAIRAFQSCIENRNRPADE